MVDATLNLRPLNNTQYLAKAKALEQRFKRATGTSGFFYDCNVEGLHWIQREAQENLRASIRKNNRPDFRTRPPGEITLENAVVQDRYSNVTSRNIDVLVHAKIVKDVPYYRALEFGSNYWPLSGRKLPFIFLGARRGANSPNFRSDPRAIFNRSRANNAFRSNEGLGPVKGSHNLVTDRLVGKREFDRRLGTNRAFKSQQFYIRIRRPVPAYRYVTRAGEQFITRGVYKDIIDRRSASFYNVFGVRLV